MGLCELRKPGVFEHFLITRFNLRNNAWQTTKANHPTLNEEWLRDRFFLFERFCLPTLAAQTEQNFIWLVYFDKSTPAHWRQRIGELCQRFPLLRPRFINGMDDFVGAIQEDIAQSPSPYVVTTRIDNDDAVSTDFIASIQRQFQPADYLALDFIDGYCLQWQPNCRLGKLRHVFNPFISLIEKNDQPKGVFHRHHAGWKRVKEVKRIQHQRIWMVVIHQENMANRFEGYGDVTLQEIKEKFRFPEDCLEAVQQRLEPVKNWRLLSLKNHVEGILKLVNKDLKRALNLYRT